VSSGLECQDQARARMAPRIRVVAAGLRRGPAGAAGAPV